MVSKWEEDSQELIIEREQDLELAAIFGKMLLDKNKELSDKIGYLEEQLNITNDQVKRLRQRISVKNKLLKIYSQDMEDIEIKYDSLVKMQQSSDICQTSLKRKSQILEASNQQLQVETFRLASLISDKEKNEDISARDFLEKLAKMSDQVEILVAELTIKTKENSIQEKTIQGLLSKIEELQKENADLYSEKMSHQKTIERMESSLQDLKKEVTNWKDQYDELLHFMEGIQVQFTSFKSWYKQRIPESVSLATELEPFNHIKTDLPYIYGSSCDDQMTKTSCYQGDPDEESESDNTTEPIHSVEKETKSECISFNFADENLPEKEKTKELKLFKQCSKFDSPSFDYRPEKWESCKDKMTVKHNALNSFVLGNMGNSCPRLFSKLQMVKQMEGSTILKQWQQLAVQQKGFGFSSDLYAMLGENDNTSVDWTLKKSFKNYNVIKAQLKTIISFLVFMVHLNAVMGT